MYGIEPFIRYCSLDIAHTYSLDKNNIIGKSALWYVSESWNINGNKYRIFHLMFHIFLLHLMLSSSFFPYALPYFFKNSVMESINGDDIIT